MFEFQRPGVSEFAGTERLAVLVTEKITTMGN
jgi:hypothetical protein